jgi:excisionase family DNA binding protein
LPEEVAEYLTCTLEGVESLITKGVLSTVKDWQPDTYPSILYGVSGESLGVPDESLTATLQVALTIPSVEEDRWLSPLEAANDLGITRKVVYRMVHRRELRARELKALASGGLWRIRQRVLETHMLRHEREAGAHPGERRISRGTGQRRKLAGLTRV